VGISLFNFCIKASIFVGVKPLLKCNFHWSGGFSLTIPP
jgi:hypothetical protein